MRKIYSKPLALFIPMGAQTDAEQPFASLTDEELRRLLLQVREEEGARVYRTTPDAILRQISDEWILVPTGNLAQHLNGMISLNRTGQFIWEQFSQPNSLNNVLAKAKEHFSDERNSLEMEVRNFVGDCISLNLLIKDS